MNASSAYIAIGESPFHSSRYAGHVGEDEDEDEDPEGDMLEETDIPPDQMNGNFNAMNAATFFRDLDDDDDGEPDDVGDDDIEEVAVSPGEPLVEGEDMDEDDVVALANLHQHHEPPHVARHRERSPGDSEADEDSPNTVGMIPAASFGEDEGCVFNFGSNYFEYDIPHGYLALDVANVSLGNLLPFNQMRGFIDISHCLTNSLPLPPYFYDATDYYKGVTTREVRRHAPSLRQ